MNYWHCDDCGVCKYDEAGKDAFVHSYIANACVGKGCNVKKDVTRAPCVCNDDRECTKFACVECGLALHKSCAITLAQKGQGGVYACPNTQCGSPCFINCN